MLEKLQAIEDKYQELEAMISDPNVMADMQRWQQHTRAHARLTPLITAFRSYKETRQAGVEAQRDAAPQPAGEGGRVHATRVTRRWRQVHDDAPNPA